MEGPKKREAELVLARRVIDWRGAVLGAFACKNGVGPLPPVRRLRGSGESFADGSETLSTTDARFRGKVTGGDFNGRRLGLGVSC